MLEGVEPRADEAVAALDLVIEEREGQVPVHGLDPERQTAQLDGQRIEIDAVDAALDDVPAEDGLEAGLERIVGRTAREQLVAEQLLGCVACDDASRLTIEQPDDRAVAGVGDAAVMMERGVERLGEKPQRRDRECSRTAGGSSSTASRMRSPSTADNSACPLRLSRIA